LIKNLPSASLAAGDIHQLCMEGTRLPVIEEIRKWMIDSQSPPILWLNGVAGSGKSTIAKQMVREWKASLAGQFFFSRDAEETRTPNLFFTTIAQQGISRLSPTARTILASGVRSLCNPVSAEIWEQYRELFVVPLKAIERTVLLVLDALDECEPETCERLLGTLLSHLSDLPHLKILLTSRPERHIEEQIQGYRHEMLSLRTDSEANCEDVDLFIRKRLQGKSFREGQIDQVVKGADGLFIWAKIVCEVLAKFRGDKDEFLKRILSYRNKKMDHIYQIALEQAIGKEPEKENVEAYMKVLGIIVVAYDPVSPETIDIFLNISNSRDIVSDLGSVLNCHDSNNVVRFLHPTFREFLLEMRLDGSFINILHQSMAVRCLKIISEGLEYDTCKFDGQPLSDNKEEAHGGIRLAQYTTSELQYSCKFWCKHVIPKTESCSSKSNLSSEIENFFLLKLLDWIYIVALQGSIDDTLISLGELASANIVSEDYYMTKYTDDGV
jgi:hypothetical protein